MFTAYRDYFGGDTNLGTEKSLDSAIALAMSEKNNKYVYVKDSKGNKVWEG
ncbi:MAG: hypothetical protein Q9M43_15950 [Sulfurimonas sp.]|nr:hypothetical protein [Sulfurimonas sp.]